MKNFFFTIEKVIYLNYNMNVMRRNIVIFLMMLLCTLPVYSFNENYQARDGSAQDTIKEVYKLNGQIEYDDNPVETIYLDENIDKPRVNIPKRTLTLPIKSLNITSNSNTSRSALARAIINRNSMGDILPLAGSVTEYYGGFSYGQTLSREISYSQMESTTAFFLKYDSPRWFSLTTAVKQASSQDIGTQYNSLQVSPEWHITKRLTLRDSFTNYVNIPKNKNEVTLVYTPALKKYAEALKFELGFAQSYYQNGKQSGSINFATGFKL